MANSRSYPKGVRNYSSTSNEDKAQPSFQFVWDANSTFTPPGKDPITGSWRALTPGDLSAEINVSGGLSVSIGAVAVTGNVNTQSVIVNTAPIPVSGVSVISNFPTLQAVSGNVSVLNFPGTFNVHETGTFTTNSTIVGGTLNVSATGILNTTGNVVVRYPSSTTVSNSTPSGANGLALTANPNRNSWFIQNVGTGVLYVKFGLNASPISYNIALKGQSTLTSFDGASWSDDGARYKGDVSVSGTFTPGYIIWEL